MFDLKESNTFCYFIFGLFFFHVGFMPPPVPPPVVPPPTIPPVVPTCEFSTLRIFFLYDSDNVLVLIFVNYC